MLAALLDLVFAPACLGCDSVIPPDHSHRLICRHCRDRLLPPPAPHCGRCGAPLRQTGREAAGWSCPECAEWPEALLAARSAFLMEPPADRLVHQLKYRGWRALAEPMGRMMAGVCWPDELHWPAVIVPVPTTRRREHERGYNQAALLAHALSRATRTPVRALLSRTSGTRTQTALQPAARAANVAGAFAARDAEGQHVILVDDVLTTGATAAECARALVAADACCVRLITFARAFEIRGLAHDRGG